MILDSMDRPTRKKEIKRLEALKEDFMKEYLAICQKYEAKLSPIIGLIGIDTMRLGMSLDKYIPPIMAQPTPITVVQDPTMKEGEMKVEAVGDNGEKITLNEIKNE